MTNSLVITTNSKGDTIAVLFNLATSYAALKATSAAIAPSLISSLVGTTDKVNGKVVSAEDAQQAVSEELESLTSDSNNGVAGWAVSVGNGIIRHAQKGTEYLQGAAVGSIVISENPDKKVSKPRGSRNGVTLAKKALRKALPVSSWKMVNLTGATRYDGDAALAEWQRLTA